MIAHARRLPTRLGFAFAIVTLGAIPALGDPIRYSTSGRFDNTTSGSLDFTGVTDAVTNDHGFAIGTVKSNGLAGSGGASAFRVRFDFAGGLPSIDVSGTVAWIGYNFDMPILDSAVTTSATEEQASLYPVAFQNLIAHPDWLHTTSFSNGIDTRMGIGASVHVEDPNEPRPIPEPSSALVVGLAAVGLGWRLSRRASKRR